MGGVSSRGAGIVCGAGGSGVSDITADVLALFIRYGIPPHPDAVLLLGIEATKARKVIVQAWEDAEDNIHKKGGRPLSAADWSRRIQKSDDAFKRQIDAAIMAPESYAGWSPSPEDWVKLAVSLAVQHEPAFEFSPSVKPSRPKESIWVRDAAIARVLLNQPKLSVAAAAAEAKATIDDAIKAGAYSAKRGTEPRIKVGEVSSMEVDFSSRRAARSRREKAAGEAYALEEAAREKEYELRLQRQPDAAAAAAARKALLRSEIMVVEKRLNRITDILSNINDSKREMILADTEQRAKERLEPTFAPIMSAQPCLPIMERTRLPPSLLGWWEAREHFTVLCAAARKMTAWPKLLDDDSSVRPTEAVTDPRIYTETQLARFRARVRKIVKIDRLFP